MYHPYPFYLTEVHFICECRGYKFLRVGDADIVRYRCGYCNRPWICSGILAHLEMNNALHEGAD